jgi:hypothetical protein
MRPPELRFDHLAAMSTDLGLYEHALLAVPRPEHGFCLDDVARGLVVTSRQPDPSAEVERLTRIYLDFTVAAQDSHGQSHNRRGDDGRWTDEAGVGDHWGRAVWGLGTAAASSADEGVRERALLGVATCLLARSPDPRSMSYAAIGCYEVLRVQPDDVAALSLLADARDLLVRPADDPQWPWPEPRLAYANAVLAEALIVIGDALDDPTVVRTGLRMLAWLLDLQTRGGHLSVTPAGGWGSGEPLPGFDQQPIEVTALAEACRRAFELTGEASWRDALDLCAAWFLGANDLGRPVYDPASGGGFDGLHRDRVNQNMGAESTLAALATLQLWHRVSLEPAR